MENRLKAIFLLVAYCIHLLVAYCIHLLVACCIREVVGTASRQERTLERRLPKGMGNGRLPAKCDTVDCSALR